MADKKISQLTAVSTPLAGTEVLPIVQSGSTVKVASDDLTVKNVRSNATNGILQVAGPAAGVTRTMTTPDANFTAARTDAAQTFTGNQTFPNNVVLNGALGSDVGLLKNTGRGYGAAGDRWIGSDGTFTNWFHNVPTGGKHLISINSSNKLEISGDDVKVLLGNLVIGTSGKGIDFSANTSAAGMTSELLDWYEEGAWTPSVGGNATYTGQLGKYTRIGRAVHIQMDLTINVLGTGSATTVSGLPFTANDYYALSTGFFFGIANNVVFISPVVQSGATDFVFYTLTAAGASTGTGTAVLGDGARIQITGTYFV